MNLLGVASLLPLLCFVVFGTIATSTYAQTNKATIKVLSSDSSAVEDAELTLYYPYNKSFAYLYTDENGTASVEVDEHTVVLQSAQKVGFFERSIGDKLEKGWKYVVYLDVDPSELSEAVVTVQYKKKTAAQAVEKIQVIDQEEIRQMAANNVRDVLQNQLNVRINQDNSTGSVLSLMGVSGNNVKILVDGVPVIGRLDGNIDLSQLNLNDIERIEVVEGPMSVSYGSNALAGVINLITKKGANKTKAQATSYYESAGYYNFDAGLNGKLGEKTNFRFSGGRYFFSGWNPTDQGRFQQWKPKEQYFGRLQLSRTFGKTNVRLKSEGFRELLLNKGQPLAPYRETAFDEDFSTYRFDQGIFIDRKINEHSSFNMLGSYNFFYRRRDKYFNDLVNLNRELTSRDGDQDTSIFTAWMFRGTYNNFKNPRFNYQIGYDIRSERGYGIRLRTEGDGTPHIADYAVFASAEYLLLHNLTIKPGLRYAYNTDYQAPIVPMVAVKYRKDKFTSRFSYSRGFRAPELKELYLSFVDVNHNVLGNPDLEAENSHNYIASFQQMFFNPKTLSEKYRVVKVELSGFYNQINNRITLVNTVGDQFTYVNLNEFESRGVNAILTASIEKLKIQLGGSYIGLSNTAENKENGAPNFNYYPEGRIRAQYGFKSLTFNVIYKFNGEQSVWRLNTEQNTLEQRTTEAYGLLDLNVSGVLFKDHINWAAGVKNLMNVTNINSQLASGGAHTSSNSSLPIGTGRSYFVRLSYQIFKK